MDRIYVDIVGDLFHIGHLNLFKQARELFDDPFLIVGVHSDKDVESYKRKPIIRQDHRYEMIRSCRLVNKVLESAPLVITKEFIELLEIDYVVHGNDISAELERQHKVPIEMGIAKYVEYTKETSTTKIIESIKQRT